MNQLITTDVKMTSLDIAEVTGKRHDHVMRDIKNEINELGKEISRPIFGESTYRNDRGREYPCYEFGKDGAMQLALKYDAKTRYNVIKYVEKLEKQPRVLSEREQLVASMKLSIETAEEFKEIKEDVSYLKGSMRIDNREEGIIRRMANKSVVQALGGKKSNAYKEMNRKAFSRFWNEFKRYFELAQYPSLPKIKFDEAVEWINEWQPDTTTRMEIRACNMQTELIRND